MSIRKLIFCENEDISGTHRNPLRYLLIQNLFDKNLRIVIWEYRTYKFPKNPYTGIGKDPLPGLEGVP